MNLYARYTSESFIEIIEGPYMYNNMPHAKTICIINTLGQVISKLVKQPYKITDHSDTMITLRKRWFDMSENAVKMNEVFNILQNLLMVHSYNPETIESVITKIHLISSSTIYKAGKTYRLSDLTETP